MTRNVTTRFTWPKPIVISTGLRSSAGRLSAKGETPGRDTVKGRLDQTQGEDEHAEECRQVAHGPRRLHRSDGAERPLPRSEEERSKGGVREGEARIREDERIQV